MDADTRTRRAVTGSRTHSETTGWTRGTDTCAPLTGACGCREGPRFSRGRRGAGGGIRQGRRESENAGAARGRGRGRLPTAERRALLWGEGSCRLVRGPNGTARGGGAWRCGGARRGVAAGWAGPSETPALGAAGGAPRERAVARAHTPIPTHLPRARAHPYPLPRTHAHPHPPPMDTRPPPPTSRGHVPTLNPSRGHAPTPLPPADTRLPLPPPAKTRPPRLPPRGRPQARGGARITLQGFPRSVPQTSNYDSCAR